MPSDFEHLNPNEAKKLVNSHIAFTCMFAEETLRLKTDKEGRLTIYPIGPKTVSGKWKRRTGPARRPDRSRYSDYEPHAGKLDPMLIVAPDRAWMSATAHSRGLR